mmetsp:Transcript_4753/g.13301  ORF Transcript_4753/g.13301 Transcript_4753/m.13301 type:complete len:268 (+) Transcript_4753:554-1357(+)
MQRRLPQRSVFGRVAGSVGHDQSLDRSFCAATRTTKVAPSLVGNAVHGRRLDASVHCVATRTRHRRGTIARAPCQCLDDNPRTVPPVALVHCLLQRSRRLRNAALSTFCSTTTTTIPTTARRTTTTILGRQRSRSSHGQWYHASVHGVSEWSFRNLPNTLANVRTPKQPPHWPAVLSSRSQYRGRRNGRVAALGGAAKAARRHLSIVIVVSRHGRRFVPDGIGIDALDPRGRTRVGRSGPSTRAAPRSESQCRRRARCHGLVHGVSK